MNFPLFWARGSHSGFACWRWSNRSLEEAQARAHEAAQRLADRFRIGDLPKRGYGYPGRPFREPVLRELKNGHGELVGVITRNSYGSLVLNTARVLFVDVDLPEPKAKGGFLNRLFGKLEATPSADPAREVVARTETWSRQHRDWGWRIYRTRAGLRLLATQAVFDPETAAVDEVFQALGADPLYRRLCKAQKCFRARLTPKPWRCGVHDKPDRWPWLTPKAEQRFLKWQAGYESACRNWATCQLFRTLGIGDIHPDVRLVVELHDEATRMESGLALA